MPWQLFVFFGTNFRAVPLLQFMPARIFSISQALSGQGLLGATIGGATLIAGGISKQTANMIGGGELAQAVTNIGGARGVNVVRNAINQHIPIEAHRALNVVAAWWAI